MNNEIETAKILEYNSRLNSYVTKTLAFSTTNDIKEKLESYSNKNIFTIFQESPKKECLFFIFDGDMSPSDMAENIKDYLGINTEPESDEYLSVKVQNAVVNSIVKTVVVGYDNCDVAALKKLTKLSCGGDVYCKVPSDSFTLIDGDRFVL